MMCLVHIVTPALMSLVWCSPPPLHPNLMCLALSKSRGAHSQFGVLLSKKIYFCNTYAKKPMEIKRSLKAEKWSFAKPNFKSLAARSPRRSDLVHVSNACDLCQYCACALVLHMCQVGVYVHTLHVYCSTKCVLVGVYAYTLHVLWSSMCRLVSMWHVLYMCTGPPTVCLCPVYIAMIY